MVKHRLLSIAALFASLFTLAVIGLGAFTRLIDAGLGCPDWPGCYGHFIAPLTAQFQNTKYVVYKAWAEMIHRYFAGSLGFFIVCILALTCFKSYRSRGNIIFGLVLLSLLVYQIILGRLTVTLKLLPIIVTQHLLGGFLILTILWLVYLNNKVTRYEQNDPSVKTLIPWAVIGLVLLFLQITLGAWTSTHYASLSCPDFPFCMNNRSLNLAGAKEAFTLFPPVGVNYEGGVLAHSARQIIQMAHRFGALIFTFYMIVFMAICVQKLKKFPSLIMQIFLIFGLLFLQIFLGIVNVFFELPLVTAMSHTLVAAMLLLAVITFTFKLARIASAS